ncbi:Protein transport protein SEC24 [Ceratocystis fimbriata CBS 114723]|uniref:Protein transport protein SEC24 n=1 Tax=Ceratocystis fimbriata CBS 114723 TaxID=1035309 RepID=A0A2C5X0F9_9PEZI|nr:Protein transport protein SEC24 [Ceratocystis fimbriata CBS 114723]
MAGPGTPSTEGPSFTPPPLPFGWIAQWDSSSKRYYYVQLSTGQSQWEVPTHAIPTGMTPHPVAEHPYGYPQPEIITFEDGSQSKRHADGTIEPVLPDGNSRPGDVATAEPVPSATGDRGIGSIAVNALLGQAKNSHGNNSHSNSNSGGLGSLGNLAGQVIGGLSGGKTNSSNNHGNTSKLSGGKLAAQLAQGLFSSSGKTGGNSANSHNPHNNHGSNSNGASPSSNYHGGTTSGAPQSHGLGGLGGSILGGLVGGNKPSSTSNFGYSNTSPNAAYNGEAPANSYQTAQNSTHGTHPQSGPPPATHYHQQPSHSSNS